jgi:ribosomal protein L37E
VGANLEPSTTNRIQTLWTFSILFLFIGAFFSIEFVLSAASSSFNPIFLLLALLPLLIGAWTGMRAVKRKKWETTLARGKKMINLKYPLDSNPGTVTYRPVSDSEIIEIRRIVAGEVCMRCGSADADHRRIPACRRCGYGTTVKKVNYEVMGHPKKKKIMGAPRKIKFKK